MKTFPVVEELFLLKDKLSGVLALRGEVEQVNRSRAVNSNI